MDVLGRSSSAMFNAGVDRSAQLIEIHAHSNESGYWPVTIPRQPVAPPTLENSPATTDSRLIRIHL